MIAMEIGIPIKSPANGENLLIRVGLSADNRFSKCYQLGFRLKLVRRALGVVRNSLRISLSRYF